MSGNVVTWKAIVSWCVEVEWFPVLLMPEVWLHLIASGLFRLRLFGGRLLKTHAKYPAGKVLTANKYIVASVMWLKSLPKPLTHKRMMKFLIFHYCSSGACIVEKKTLIQ